MTLRSKTTVRDPIITTLLDTDLYKYTMQQLMVSRYPDAHARMEFHCRDLDSLGVSAAEVRAQIDALGTLTLPADELAWLCGLPFISAEFVEYLRGFKLNPNAVTIHDGGTQLEIVVEGVWHEVTHYEIFILAIISELHGRQQQRLLGDVAAEGERRLQQKLAQLPADSDINIIDFGTRRRFSAAWQQHVLQTLQAQRPNNVTGTSNLHLARTLNLTPMGTMAHEWLQSHQVLGSTLRNSQLDALNVWLDAYGKQLSIALTDTISMKAFLNDFDAPLAHAFNGLRHDSGDPIVWGEQALAHYEKLGIDAREKTLVFSDKLTFEKALRIHQWFAGKVNVSFGIGTYLTNDLGFKAPNIVLKLTELNGQPVAKLSDSPGKTLCNDAGYVDLLKRTFNYRPQLV